MAWIYSNAVRTSRSQAVIDAIGTAGVLVIGDNTLAGTGVGVLAIIPFSNPAFTQVNGVMTVNNLPRTVNAVGAGTASKAEFRSSTGVVVVSGLTVGVSGSSPDIVINATSITVGQSVQCTVGTITPQT